MESRTVEGETRKQIMALMLKVGPISASAIAEELNLTPTGIRRHLDAMVADSLAEVAPNKGAKKGRGRPAKTYRLTDRGRAQFGHGYDELAYQALTTLKETGGEEAVRAFARKRAEELLSGVEKLASSGANIGEVAEELVRAFSEHGYEATLTDAGHSVQICQHHCPISGVAAEFPQLCEAEHQAIAQLLGHHVQPLASIVDGHDLCTTNIPITPIVNTKRTDLHPPQERSGS
ncbi:hypothetical protein CGERO_05830 [Corynebacterium gerontici]|uniref:Transcriptional regulator n=2 Tax=Corynebacterium gerontici TaxID=2079234 RepID=A0A3G6J104_9CORY|nr:hypothetical protein CGERO_05830 [Corynebacterium gerontici]